MTFSFSIALDDDISRVRQMLGDTVDAGHAIEDETIQAYLSTRSELATAAQLARDLAAKYARQIDSDIDGQSLKASQRYKQLSELAADLARQAAAENSTSTTDTGDTFAGVAVFGATYDEVVDARADPNAAANAPLRWYPWS